MTSFYFSVSNISSPCDRTRMVLQLLLAFLLNHIHPGLTDEYNFDLQDISIDGSTPLEIPSNYSHKVQFHLRNVSIRNPTADTYKLFDYRVSVLDLVNCSASQNFYLPLINELEITNTDISDIIIADGYNIIDRMVSKNTSIKSIPTNIRKLTNLRTILWSDNEIGTLDLSVLNGLEALLFFELTRCSISKVTDQNAVILPSLAGLALDGNQISHIATQKWIMPHLTHLNLENNQLTQLPKVKQFRQLNILNLGHNLISHITYAEWATMAHIGYLDLSYNRILHLDSSGAILFPRLVNLKLNGNHFSSLDISKWKMPKLLYLGVEHNQLRSIDGFDSIVGTLSEFDFAGNPWDCEWVHFAMVEMENYLQRAWAKSC